MARSNQSPSIQDPGQDIEGIPTDFDQLETSEFGLDWGDVQLIRERLKLSPTERLRAAQKLANTAIRIRAQNAR